MDNMSVHIVLFVIAVIIFVIGMLWRARIYKKCLLEVLVENEGDWLDSIDINDYCKEHMILYLGSESSVQIYMKQHYGSDPLISIGYINGVGHYCYGRPKISFKEKKELSKPLKKEVNRPIREEGQ